MKEYAIISITTKQGRSTQLKIYPLINGKLLFKGKLIDPDSTSSSYLSFFYRRFIVKRTHKSCEVLSKVLLEDNITRYNDEIAMSISLIMPGYVISQLTSKRNQYKRKLERLQRYIPEEFL